MDTPDIVEWEALCAFAEWLNDLYADMRALGFHVDESVTNRWRKTGD